MKPTIGINDFGQVNYIYKEIKDSVSSLEEVKNKNKNKNNILSHF